MKTLGALWIFFVIIGNVFCETIVYPGREALQSYSPARGEFPVQSLFGRGYLSYIDGFGNSKIVNFEPNPLLGVRVSSSGQQLFDVGRKIDGSKEEQVFYGKGDHGKHDRLKPIKEFDEHPFVDSEDWQENLDSKMDALPAYFEQPQVDTRLEIPICNKSAAMARQNFPRPTQNMFSTMNPFLPIFSPSSSLGNAGTRPSPVAASQNPFLTQNSRPSPSSGQTQINPTLPPATGFNGQNPFLPARPTSGPLLTNPTIPPNAGPVFPNPSPPATGFGSQNPFLTGIRPSPPTNPPSSGQTNLNLTPPTTAPTKRPTSTTGFPNPPPPTAAPLPNLPTWGQVFPSPLPPTNWNTGTSTKSPPIQLPTSPPVVFSNPLPPRPVTSTTSSPNAVVLSPSAIFQSESTAAPNISLLIDEIFNTNFTQLTPAQIQAMVINFDIRNERKIPVQVTDTPEVEAAKRGHFLAHELALAQLKSAHHQDDTGNESSSLHLTVLHSLLNAIKVASSQAVISVLNNQKVDTVESDTVSSE